ncbi:MAG: GH92 family glycosyl hydrolase [Bacteroidota bacterium]|nr:GH92 family glycosyl hydrolase [Bacteroidota bacterium]
MSIFFVFLLILNAQAQTKLTQYVNPMVGTSGHGHTYPGAALPFGLVQLSPDTDDKGWDWCSGYHYSDSSIIGFSHTHLSGTGCADLGDILIMPTTGKLKTEPGQKDKPGSGYRSSFSHKTEIAKAGYYSVMLDDYNIKAELTSTLRAGFHKYTFPKNISSNIIIDLVHGIEDKTTDSEIRIVDNKTIEGYRRSTGWARDHCVYFYAEFSKPFKSFGIVDNGQIQNGKNTAKGKLVKAFVQYATSNNQAILIKVGISHTSIEGAKLNLKSEIPDWNFEAVKKKADNEWEKQLSLIKTESKDKETKTVFYTALYHSLLNPNTFSDENGSYMGMDRKIHPNNNFTMYTTFSLWDIFRGLNPLFSIIERDKELDIVKTLIAKYDESGLLPVWELMANETGTMPGYHANPMIADAYSKGITGFDANKALEAMKKSAMQDHLGLDSYKQMGYITSDLENESVSKTLEYAYDDWCIAKMAKALGKDDDYKYFIERAQYYKNLFDKSTSLMRAKKNGKWFEPFDPFSVSGNYTEANAWQYSFFVPQDISGLMKLMGGVEQFRNKLDELFTNDPKLTGHFQADITGLIGQYAQGNEPSHHMAYLYNYAGQPWKTQERIHQILTTMYNSKPDGLCGNEDCGQMSAWYVLSAMGFYPVCPGETNYAIGTPLFNSVTIKAGNKNFVIKANNLSDKNFYIQSATLNGKKYDYSYIDQSDIMKGGELVFEMGPKPSLWATAMSSWPVTSINEPFVIVPYLISGERVFSDSASIGLASVSSTAKIFYSLDGSDPIDGKNLYSQPLVIKNSTTLKAVSFENGIYSKVVTAKFNKITEGRTIKLNTQFHHSYTGGGAYGLIDSVHGTSNFHTDAWQGYEGNDLDAVIDLGKQQKISFISASFLQNTGSWIFFPKQIEYYVSNDNVNFTKVYETENNSDKNDSPQAIKDFDKSLNGIEARYVRVYAKNIGVCPEWHVASGNKAWLFVDEITVR